ncbi:MAG: glycosyltransferase family A protein [Lacunisphaera sp.]
MSPLVSIIIPCFNAARWLPATLESALAQTYAAREIIVIDDGSTDNSRTVAESYADRGVRVVTQTNAGQGAACNHGLRLARGEYVKFFDADDLLSPDMLVRQVTALGNHPGSLAYSEWARFHADPAEATFVPRPGWHDAAPVDWLVEILADAQQ